MQRLLLVKCKLIKFHSPFTYTKYNPNKIDDPLLKKFGHGDLIISNYLVVTLFCPKVHKMTNMVAKNHSLHLDKLVNLFRDSMCTFVQSLTKMTNL